MMDKDEAREAAGLEIKKRKGRWGTTHFFIDGILRGDYQKTGNAFDTQRDAEMFRAGYDAGRESLRAENERLRAALEHYADKDNWWTAKDSIIDPARQHLDVLFAFAIHANANGFNIAREALEAILPNDLHFEPEKKTR